MRKHLLCIGDPAPWFTCRMDGHDKFNFDTAAGRNIVICFLGSLQETESKQVIDVINSHRHHFDDINLTFFGVVTNESDLNKNRIPKTIPGIRYPWDFDLSISKAYGAVSPVGIYRKVIYILDPSLRVMNVIPFPSESNTELSLLSTAIENNKKIRQRRLASLQAPVLVLPRVFEPKMCNNLIDYYNKIGGKDSGYMRDVNGKTVGVIDHSFKSRRDCRIMDETLRQACMLRIHKRLMPEVEKAFQFSASQLERYIIACYDAEEKGFFHPHRDNTTIATAHRRFAVSLFLNSDYEGGYLRFPEYGPDLYTAPKGGAVVFSCSLLHEATKVTKGRRYMFLPFIYDDAGKELRKHNSQFLESTIIRKTEENARSVEPDSENNTSLKELL